MEEIWKDVIGYEGLYQISNLGRIKSLTRKVQCKGGQRTTKGKILKPFQTRNPYLCIDLRQHQTHKTKFIHRLVAEAFIPNPNNYPQVNHIDGNKLNNNVDNLEWCTNEYNFQHALKTGLIKKKSKGYHQPYSRSVNQYDLQGNFIKHWNYISDASKELNISLTSIYRNCNNQTKKPKYYLWRYAN